MQRDLNRGTLSGRLGQDAKFVNDGKSKYLQFNLAFTRLRRVGDVLQEESNFANDLVLFGDRAEALAPLLKKGKAVGIEYELKQNKWKDGEGKDRSELTLFIVDIQLF